MQAKPRRHLMLPRRPSWERSGRLVLLALVEDRLGGHPDNVAATARHVGATERTVRAWRAECLDDGLLERRDGFLVPGPCLPAWKARAAAEFKARGLLWSWDPIPRRALRRMSPDQLHAAAVVYGDAIGFRPAERYVRSDEERAAMANVSRPTVRAARKALVAAGWCTLEVLRRGRACLRRVALNAESRATHGQPIGEGTARRLAAAGGRQRAAAVSGFATKDEAPATRKQIASETRKQVSSHHQDPTDPSTIKASSACQDGRSRREPDGPQSLKPKAPSTAADPAERRAEVERFLGDKPRLRAFLDTRQPEAACRQLLELTGYGDRSRRSIEKWPRLIAMRFREAAPTMLACLIADVAQARGLGRANNIGAVVAKRLPRLVAGKGSDALSERLQTSTPEQVLGLTRPPAARREPPAAPRTGGTRAAAELIAGAVPTFQEFLRQRGIA